MHKVLYILDIIKINIYILDMMIAANIEREQTNYIILSHAEEESRLGKQFQVSGQ